MNKAMFPGWWQVAVSCVNQGVSSGSIIVAYSVIAVSLKQEFGASGAELGLIMTLTYLINGLANPIAGTAMDRYSLRKVLIFGSLCLVVGYIALSFATSMLHVFLAYGIFLALANATLGPLSYSTLLPRWFVRMRARAVGITALGYSIGGLTLPLIFHYLVAEFGWRDALRLFAGVMLVFVVPFVAWKVIDRPSDVGVYPDGDAAPPPAAASSNAATAPELPTLTVMRDINFWVLVLTIGLVVSGAAGVLANMSPYAISKGFSSAQGAIAVSCFAAGSFSSKTLFAAFGDRLKPRVGLLTGLFFFTVSSFGFMHADAYPVLLAAAYVHGLSVGTMLPLWSYLTALTFGSAHVGRVFGLITVTMMPISLIAPPLLGRIADVTGSYDNGFMLYVGLGLASALLVSRFRPEASAAAIAAAAA